MASFLFGCVPLAKAYCGTHPSVESEFKGSKVVVVGTALSSKDVLDPNGFIQGTFYTIRTSEVLKGSRATTLLLYSENSSGRFTMEAGTPYLIFAYEGVFEGIAGSCLVINNCGNSGTLSRSKDALATTRKLRQQSSARP